MEINEAKIREIVQQVVSSMDGAGASSTAPAAPQTSDGVAPPPTSYGDGVFASIEEAVSATIAAQRQWLALPLEKRKVVVEAVRCVASDNAEQLARMVKEETGMGRVSDKILKHQIVAQCTPGFEDLETRSWTGDHGLTIEEMAPFGVIGAITPSTHPSPTMLHNTICNLVAGNGVVFNAHPAGKRVFAYALQLTNRAVVQAGGPANVVSCIAEPTIDSANELFNHPDIKLLLITGGPGVVEAAMQAPKKVVAAGPGNPPVVVDETADLARAAKCIVEGASFDCNILCTAEKEIFVVEAVADELKRHLAANGCYELTTKQTDELAAFVFPSENGKVTLNRKAVGRDAETLAKTIGLSVPSTTRMLIGETDKRHAFVEHEQMTSFIPIVRCTDVDQAIEFALEAEHGFGHTAVMHSRDVANMDKMARLVNTTIFVKNGPSGAGNGFGGEGTLTYSIATPTGEGITTPRTFTRKRRCTLVDYFRII